MYISTNIIFMPSTNYASYLGARRCCDIRGSGPQGPQGSQGTSGAIGSIGVQGTQGAQGSEGAQGAQGSQGPAGTSGLESAYGDFNIGVTIGTYTQNTKLSSIMITSQTLVEGQTYAIHVGAYIEGSSVNLPYSNTPTEQQYYLSCNIQPDTQQNIYVYPIIFSNPSTSASETEDPSNPFYCQLSQYASSGVNQTVVSGSFSTYFVYTNTTNLNATNPYYVNVYLGNSGTSANASYSNITFTLAVSVNPLSSV